MIIRSSDLHTLDIPHEPGESIVIRKLNRKQMRKAADKRQLAAIGKLRDFGGPVFMRELQEMGGAQAAKDALDTAESVAKDPLDDYDEDALLELGVAAWSYRDKETGEAIPVDEHALDALDEITAPYVARAIVKFHRGEIGDSKNG